MMLEVLPWIYFSVIAITLFVAAVEKDPSLCGVSAGAFVALLGHFSYLSVKTQIVMYTLTLAVCTVLPAAICRKKDDL